MEAKPSGPILEPPLPVNGHAVTSLPLNSSRTSYVGSTFEYQRRTVADCIVAARCAAAKVAAMSLVMRSTFAGQSLAFKPATVQSRVARLLTVDAKKVCDLTGKKRNKANSVCFSNKKSRKWQEPNLQNKKVFWEEGQRWVRLRICTKAIKTLEKKGLHEMANEVGIDLWKLPFEDARPQRKAFLAENKGKVPVARKLRQMKDQEKLAASKKQPRYPVYDRGGRIVYIRPGMEERLFGKKEQDAAPEELELKITLTE